MGMISEENKSGTMEILLTSPIPVRNIVLGKYFALLSIVGLILLISLTYVVTIFFISFPQGNIDLAGISGSYIGLFLLSCSFAAIGIFSSACTSAQITSFVLGSMICIFLYSSFDLFSILQSFNKFSFYIQQLGIKFHYDAISKGLINLKDVIYFAVVAGSFLFFTEDKIKKMQK
jgi:ABC-2 type transport system permease protein